MRKLLKVALVALGVVFMSNFAQAQAQVKIGYAAYEQLVPLLPQFKTAQTALDAFQKTYSDKYTSLATELQTKGKDYETKRTTMTDAARSIAETDIQDLQKRLQDFQTKAQTEVGAKQEELYSPLITQVKTAVAAVAKEKGYAYVFNTTSPDLLLVAPPADDLLPFVKTKLGLK